jgi:hypothetical protein
MYDDIMTVQEINARISYLITALAYDQKQLEQDNNTGYYVYVEEGHALCLRRALERRQELCQYGNH